MMTLKYFTEESYYRLLYDVSKNENRYRYEDNSWVQEYFNYSDDYYKISSVEVKEFHPFYIKGKKTDKEKTVEDLINAKGIFKAFENLTPYQSSNRLMWTYLTHCIPEYYEYTKDRWLQDPGENTIETRFFVRTYENLYNDHSLSRLFNAARLAYRPFNKENPLYMLDKLMINQTVLTDVLDTFNRMSPNRLDSVLFGITDFIEEIGSNRGISNYFRDCKKHLNHDAAVRSYDILNNEEIRKITYEHLIQSREKKLSEQIDERAHGGDPL